MGMKKGKVALQFITEVFAVTLASVLVGAVIGAACQVPVTNALLAGQIESQSNRADELQQSFGRGEMSGGMGDMSDISGGMSGGDMFGGGMPSFSGMFEDVFTSATDYVTTVNSAVNLTVLLQMLGIAVLLTLISGGQQQRVAIARALSYEAEIILADEPTGNLDEETQNDIMGIFKKLVDDGKCVILVSHSPAVAAMCDEKYELKRISRRK